MQFLLDHQSVPRVVKIRASFIRLEAMARRDLVPQETSRYGQDGRMTAGIVIVNCYGLFLIGKIPDNALH